MKFTIPVHIEETVLDDASGQKSFQVKPLFQGGSGRRGPILARVLARFSADLRKSLKLEAGEYDHKRLVEWSYCPEYEEDILDLQLSLKKASVKRKFLVIWYELSGSRYASIPEVDGAIFEFKKGDDLKKRCVDVLTEVFKKNEADDEPSEWATARMRSSHSWTTTIDISIDIPVAPDNKANQDLFSIFGSDEELSGDMELEHVGHCLTELYPDGLTRTSGRQREVVRLTNLLEHGGNRPVLIIGKALSGKTALINEVAWRLADERRRRGREGEKIWLLSPQRLISGMSYVGQWESRLMAILQESRKRRHILYFDDLPGLFFAGQTADSQVAVADILRNWMEKRDVRVLGEITPEAWRKMRERDRRFADLFDVVHLPPATDRETVSIIVDVQRELENRNQCQFEPEGLPLVIRLLKQYANETAFPGKAIRFMDQLALKNSGKSIGQAQVLDHFSSQTGMDPQILDMRVPLKRSIVEERLQSMIAGQEKAVQAMVDIVMMVKARLNDPSRPVTSMLFLGPTGVGKTESAKALARVLFQNDDRLIRFDMNEFLDPGSARRMIGTSFREEGLLTRKIRQQPFSVVLFDEIEKADPEIFDLLLAVLGEGRLTDAMGRTVSFANTVVIMTSNLGVKEAHSRVGYGTDDPSQIELSYLSAARQFFKPEFFNRLDHVIPFRSLTHDESLRVANIHLRQLGSRFGLQERKCFISYHPSAMSLLISKGFHPQYGGRALKRVIEKEIAGRLSVRLAVEPMDRPLFIAFNADVDKSTFSLDHKSLVFAGLSSPSRDLTENLDPAELVPAVSACLRRIRSAMSSRAPGDLALVNQNSPAQLDYLLVLEQFHKVSQMADDFADSIQEGRKPAVTPVNHPARGVKIDTEKRSSHHTARKSRDKDALNDLMDSIADQSSLIPGQHDVVSLLLESSLLNLMVDPSGPETCIIHLSCSNRLINEVAPFRNFLEKWKEAMASLFRMDEKPIPPLSAADHESMTIELALEGPACTAIAQSEEGFWMIERNSGEIGLAHIRIILPESTETQKDSSSQATVLRSINENHRSLDNRTGCLIQDEISALGVRQLILAPMHLPTEIHELTEGAFYGE